MFNIKVLPKELKAEVAAIISGHREVFEQYNRSCWEWLRKQGQSRLTRPSTIKTGHRNL